MMVDSRRGESQLERDSRKVKLNNPKVPSKGCTRPETFNHKVYQSILDPKDLFEIRVSYGISEEFDLELPNLDVQVNNPPPGWLGVYKEAFEIGLRFLIPSFLLNLLTFYSISLCTLTPNSLRIVLGFLIICFPVIWPSLSLFHALYTIKRHPYIREW